MLTVRTEQPLPAGISEFQQAWVQRQVMAMFVACLRIAVVGGEDLENLAYPEFLEIDQRQVDGYQEKEKRE